MFTNEYFPTRCPHEQGEGGRGEGGQPNADRGSGGQESLEMCGHPLWMAPYHSI